MALTKVETALAISLPVLFVVVGLVVILVITSTTNAKPSKTQVVKPPLNPDDSGTRPQKAEVCAPGSDGYKGLVPCTKQATCNGCREYIDESNQYSCVTVSSGNNSLDANGLLVEPMVVSYKLPPSNTVCTGHGTYDKNTKLCKCDPNYSGANCDIYKLSIYTPGSFCMPSYAKTCNSPTTDSVLVNQAGGKGGQFTCACKPEYKGLYMQAVEGGVCDVPLVCGASSPQMNPDMKTPEMFSVFDSIDANGVPVFKSAPVFANRPTSYNTSALEPCVSKVNPLVTDDKAAVPYKVGTVAADADPTCKPSLYSNECRSYAQPGQSAVDIVVRGSNSPGDPLLKRVTPSFFPPVPPALRRCPLGTTGSNSPSSPCVCACDKSTDPTCPCNLGDTLYLQPSKVSHCNDDTWDPYTPDTEFEDKWYTSAFDERGEWNGAFTCVNDLTSARMKFGNNGTPILVSSSAWPTVTAVSKLREVDCIGSSEWVTRTSYNASTQEFKRNEACVGPNCEGVAGSRAMTWNGNRDGPLVDEKGNPWFAIAGTTEQAQATFGGQCACDGVAYRGRGDVPLREVPQYLTKNKEAWWQCGADTCSTESNPGGYLQDGTTPYPKCVCNQPDPDAKVAPPFKTEISYAPQNELPTCVKDPCNPSGFKTTSSVKCTDTSQCSGVCYSNRCHYPRSGETCISDESCTTYNGARIQGKCVPVSVLDPKSTSSSKECVYEDKDRASLNSFCTYSSDCNYGECVAYSGSSATGVCSGGCACSPDTVQQPDNSSPLGYTCLNKCFVTPCVEGHTEAPCSVDPVTGVQTCKCKPCYSGKYCELSSDSARLGEECDNSAKPGEPRACCEGSCSGSKCVK
jgi:hypothetical protein